MLKQMFLFAIYISAFIILLMLIKKKWKQALYSFLVQIPFIILLLVYVLNLKETMVPLFGWPFLFGPVLYTYIKGMTGSRFSWKYSIHLLFPAIITIFSIFIIPIDQLPEAWRPLYGILHIASLAVYYFLIRRYTQKRIVYLKNYFSTLKPRITFRWIIHLLLIYLIFTVANLAIMLFNRFFTWLDPEHIPQAHLFINAIFVIIFNFYAVNQSYFQTSDLNEDSSADSNDGNNQDSKYLKSKIEENEIKGILNILENYMNANRAHLDSDFSMERLSSDTGIPRHKISQALNMGAGINFYEYVNCFRVEEFKKQLFLARNQHLSILGIAYNCGFNSKSSFNFIFKKTTGITPSEYKSQNNKSEPIG